MGIIDVLVIITVFISVIFALYRGLVRELMGITSWILAGIAGLYSYSWAGNMINRHTSIENEVVAGIIGSVLIAVVVLVVMTLINACITSKLRESSLSGLDRVLGFLFGIFRAWLLIGIAYIACAMVFSEKQLAEAEGENLSLPYIQKSATLLEKFIPETIKKDIKAYEQGKLKEKNTKKIGKEIIQKAAEYEEETRESLDDLIEQVGG